MQGLCSADTWETTPPPAEFSAVGAPVIDTEPVPLCPVCRHGEFDRFAMGFDYELLTCRNPWRFVACRQCGHVWLNPRPAVRTLGVIYPPTYYAYNYRTQINPIAIWGKELLDRSKLRGIVRSLSRPPQSYVDIGCGEGRFLRAMRARGLDPKRIYGIELDEPVVRRLNESGFRAFCQRAEECDAIPQGTLDLATMFHVLEHVAEPAAVAAKVFSWMAPGGVFAVETPNVDSVDARWFKETYWGGYHIPRHWSLFTPATLALLLRDAGFEIIGTRYQTGHSFWMYSIHHRLRYAARPWPRLARWFNPLRGLPALIGFTALDKLRAALGCRTSAMLMLARKPV